MEDLSVGGNPLLQLEEKLVMHKTKFTWAFVIMALVILILVIVVIWLAATKQSAPTPKTAEGFNASFNQVDYSGLTGNSSTNESNYDKFAERLVPKNSGRQGFDVDPRNSTQKRFDNAFEGGHF